MVVATSAAGAIEADPAEVVRAVGEAQAALAAGQGDTWWSIAPLAVRVDAYDHDRARVSVWVVRVLSRAGVAAAQSSWVTTTLELVWERDDWRVWSSADAQGPTPVLDGADPPSTAAGLNERLQGFELIKDHR
jgi:hypothetical protein